MKNHNEKVTAFICLIVGIIALFTIYLFIDLRIDMIQDQTTDIFFDVVLRAEKEYIPSRDQALEDRNPMDQSQMVDAYWQFLEEINKELNEGMGFPVYSDLIRYETDEYGRYIKDEYGKVGSRVIDSTQLTGFGKAGKIHENVFGSGLYSGSESEKGLFGFGAITSYWAFEERCFDHQYRVTVTYSPFNMLLAKEGWLYVLMLLWVGTVEWGIVLLRRRMYKGRRFKELMASTLITGFSHELKTPLAVLKASVENWDYIEEKDKDEYSQKITTEVDHLEKMIGKLLDINQLDAGKIKPKPEKINLYSITKEAYEQIKPLMDHRKLSVDIHTNDPERCVVKGDPQLLRVAVNNFISNAVKYAGSKVEVELTAGKNVIFKVSNDGNGLDKESSKKVWNLFYKTDTSRTNRLGSSGVGLAVTKSILRAHKAKYGCTPGKDETIFWFEMKRV